MTDNEETTSSKKNKYEAEIKVLEMIAQDAEDDATYYDGRPFNGRLCGEYMGKQGAAIAALAKLLATLLSNGGVKDE